MEQGRDKITIKCWAEDDRPREKLLLKGRNALSDAELIAILIGSGTARETAVDLAKRILGHVGDNLAELSKMSVNDLKRFRGIGEAKALCMVAAMEIGRRRRTAEAMERERVTCSKDAFEIFHGQLASIAYEEFWIILMNKANKVIRKVNISEGGLSGTVVDPKKIFKIALEQNATGIILCHNHPSGNIKPSEADIKLTRQLQEAGKLMEMVVLDHIIIGEDRYFSFADEGMM
ncbi:MAG: JAB domain-containing protein [Bacteroidetes bacterium]|nr:JAB domain-containing protein [Bacteroidota bacterium]